MDVKTVKQELFGEIGCVCVASRHAISLVAEVETLQGEVEALKAENAVLRRHLEGVERTIREIPPVYKGGCSCGFCGWRVMLNDIYTGTARVLNPGEKKETPPESEETTAAPKPKRSLPQVPPG